MHSVQISQITPEQPRLTLHACVADARDAAGALDAAKDYLERRYNIRQSTIQIEIGENCPDNSAPPAAPPSASNDEAHLQKGAVGGRALKAHGGGAAAFAGSD